MRKLSFWARTPIKVPDKLVIKKSDGKKIVFLKKKLHNRFEI